MESILKAPAERELAWLMEHGAPRLPREPLNHKAYDYEKNDPHVQLEALAKYLDVVPRQVSRDNALHRPVIRHPDLSPSNIFVTNEGTISGLIDWQHCSIMPLALHARIPTYFHNWDDEDSENFHSPALPATYKSLTALEQNVADERFSRRQLATVGLWVSGSNMRP